MSWFDLFRQPAEGRKKSALVIEAAGLCCSLGYHLDAVVCALRANMDHFQESAFFSRSGDPINAAFLPEDIFGQERQQRWIEHAVRDCARSLSEPHSVLDPRRTAIVVLAPDTSRPHSDSNLYATLVLDALSQLDDQQPPVRYRGITVVSQGRAGLAQALTQASHLLSKGMERVLLIGVDSYLNVADINQHLRDERLFVSGNTNGFVPGEAAAALLLRAPRPDMQGTYIQGIGEGDEPGRPDGSVPSRAMGLSAAMRAACQQAGIEPNALEFRISDQNGEQFFAREAANALARVLFGGPKLPHLTVADKIGEVGAAAGPAMLAWLWRDMPRADCSPGTLGLLHLANDDGRRCAVVLQYQGERQYGNPRLR